MVRARADTAACIEKFYDYLCEQRCQPLTKNELLAHYIACRDANTRSGGRLRWPSFSQLFYMSVVKRSPGNGQRIRHLVCTLCGLCQPDLASLRRHLSDEGHITCARNLRAEAAQRASGMQVSSSRQAVALACPLQGCQDQLANADQLFRHMSWKAHFVVLVTTAEHAVGMDGGGDGRMPSSLVEAPLQQYSCLMCGRLFASRDRMQLHSGSCEYREAFLSERNVLARGHDDIDITYQGVPPLSVEVQADGAVHGMLELAVGQGKMLCTIKTQETFELYSCTFNSKLITFTMRWLDPPEGSIGGRCSEIIEAGRSYVLQLSASNCTAYGYHPGVMQLAFRKVSNTRTFPVVKPVNLRIVSSDFQLLRPSAPYRPKEPPALMSSTILNGQPPDRPTNNHLEYVLPLEKYPIPYDIREPGHSRQSLNTIRAPLTAETYREKFSKLLFFEELQMERDIKRYTIANITMKKVGLFLELEVPGLAEKRPSVLRGDTVRAAVLTADFLPESRVSYRGYVHQVQLSSLVIRFHDDLLRRFITGMRFSVEFSFNRLPMQLSHRAVVMAVESPILRSVLFPNPFDELMMATRLLSQLAIDQLRFYNQQVEQNTEQNRAVKAIVAGSSVPAPYLIFGPPGTGKTVTMVEAIKQIYFLRKGSYILTCAPQNEAADLLAERLLRHIPKHDIIRLNATSRQKNEISHKEVAEIANYTNGEVFYPAAADLMKKRILVCTLVTAGRLVSSSIGRALFTHIFIDESGHSIEPEAVIPISGLLKVENNQITGQLVLAGDPKQLGPVIRSPQASSHGLALSLLERLMIDRELYQRSQQTSTYNHNVLTKLVNNYRSHPDILHVPNELFYENELQVCADVLERNKFCQWSELPRQGFPIIIHGVHGKDEQEGDSPSFFNIDEASCVAEYAQKLLELRAPLVKPEHIGIIAPYRKQVQKIRRLLEDKDRRASPNLGLSKIKTGSVEEFQGQERPVIIISTVRSTKPDFMKIDIEYNLGFLKNPKRFNVAVTRAKSLLIVVGNPDLLIQDDSWRRFLQYCILRGGGKPPHMFTSLFEDGTSVDDIDCDADDTYGDGGAGASHNTAGGDGASMVHTVNDPEWRGHL